jgi:hypothetical protein
MSPAEIAGLYNARALMIASAKFLSEECEPCDIFPTFFNFRPSIRRESALHIPGASETLFFLEGWSPAKRTAALV